MSKIFQIEQRLFGRPPTAFARQPRRNEVRRLVLQAIRPLLDSCGFDQHKGSRLWRIVDGKSDVIELRFLTAEEARQHCLPLSTFSVLYGCYYPFVPAIFDDRYLHQIPGLITPLEVHCHYRGAALRTLAQGPTKMDATCWHLEESGARQADVLENVVEQLRVGVVPRLDQLADLDHWLLELHHGARNLGMETYQRKFLLAFTCRHLGKIEEARQILLAVRDSDRAYREKYVRFFRDLSPDAPLFRQMEIVEHALSELSSIV